MSNIKDIKKHILKNVCMIMLVLIQFDVCGYDLIHALHIMGEPALELAATDLSVEDRETEISQWDDLVYRRVTPRTAFKIPAVEFPSFISFLHAGEFPYNYRLIYERQSQTALSDPSYLRYCVLRI